MFISDKQANEAFSTVTKFYDVDVRTGKVDVNRPKKSRRPKRRRRHEKSVDEFDNRRSDEGRRQDEEAETAK